MYNNDRGRRVKGARSDLENVLHPEHLAQRVLLANSQPRRILVTEHRLQLAESAEDGNVVYHLVAYRLIIPHLVV
jgi:hypothetical protein